MVQVMYKTKYNGVDISIEALDVDYIAQKGANVVGFSINDRGGLLSTDAVGFVLVALETGHFEVLKGLGNFSAFRNDLVRENAISCDEYIASGGEKEDYEFLASIYQE